MQRQEGMRENGELRELLVSDITKWFELIENEKQTMAISCKPMLEMLKGFRCCPKVIENC